MYIITPLLINGFII
jgi:hypothetical protein